MTRGVIVTNADDPRTALIGLDKEKDVTINYYGIESEGIEDLNGEDIACPKCGEFKLPHRICKNCGTYDGKEVLKAE